jgi:uncharacterized protein (TIGR00255 family)
MIKSMTGYGRREAASASGSVAVEARSVNHRFCEVVTRLPRGLAMLEEELKRLVQRTCARGRIELIVTVSSGRDGAKRLSLDRPLAAQYHRVLRDLKQHLKLPGQVDLALLAGFRELFSTSDQAVDEKKLAASVKKLATQAVADLDRMRRSEGEALARDVRERLHTIGDVVEVVRTRVPSVAQEALDRMKLRIEKLVAGDAPDPARLRQELAVFADRYDVSEELTRLDSHLEQFASTLESREPVGRTLDFLLQEMGREVNTIGSKANDAQIAAQVVQLKSELEKIREQVQNIE